MNDLITITEQDGQKVVSARELHEFLDIGADFTNWVKRMLEYGFEEGTDFTPILAKSTGGRPKADYALILRTAKEWSMLQRNEKGQQARRYFIEIEEKTKGLQVDFTDPDTIVKIVQNWKDEHDKRLEAEKQVARLKPAADLAKRAIDAEGLIKIGQCAKVLQLAYGRNTLFKVLRSKGILMSNNEPYQKYVNQGCFILKELTIQRHNHPDKIVLLTLVTQKGLKFLHSILCDEDQTLQIAKVN